MVDPQELARVIELRGHAVRIHRNEVKIETCVLCGNPRWNLEVSASKGVFHCWACGKGGTAESLLERIGAQAPPGLEVRYDPGDDSPAPRPGGERWPEGTVPVGRQPSAVATLRQRGVSEADASWLGVGVALEGAFAPRLVFPLEEYWSGLPVGYVTRSYGPATDGPKYMSSVNVVSSLPGWMSPDGGWRVHVVVEGVFDALSVRRAGFGAAMLLGLGHFDDAQHWACRAEPDEPVVVMLDAEAASMGRRLYWTLRAARSNVHVAELPPGRDPGEMESQEVRRCVLDALTHNKRKLA